jgi:glycosyltransferase involved in cell wall biosynthesis
MKRRLAVVVQRCHESIVGGSEALAWQYANLLKSHYNVEILTSTALDYRTWASELPTGSEIRDGVTIRRFAPDRPREIYWHQLHERLLTYWRTAQMQMEIAPDWLPWSLAMQEEFIRWQGPFCPGLVDYVAHHHGDYASFIFVTYLYPTSYFCLPLVPVEKVFFAPTLHDEPTAYLPAFRHLAQQVGQFIWMTSAEQQLTRRFWGDRPGTVVGMSIETEQQKPKRSNYPYILYSGRVDENKGCRELVDFFLRYKQAHPSKLRLILTGQDNMGLPRRSDVEFLGFVSSGEKMGLMAGAQAFVMPSKYESFSIATLEAMSQGTPVLVNGDCDVLLEHVDRSQGGIAYNDFGSFAEGLSRLIGLSDQARRSMGMAAERYVLENYTTEAVQGKLISVVDPV